MREALFVKQNSEKWKSFEHPTDLSSDGFADRFIEITNDLSYAKTFYPDSKTTAYLNGLASKLHQAVYTNKKEKTNRFVNFWRIELPLIFYQQRIKIGYSFVFFIIAYLIGFVSAKYDETFVRLILGDGYVNMTLENIRNGDPFGVYKRQGEMIMFIMIAGNNIFVSLRMFVFGALGSLGTVVFALYNGIMIGAFQYFFISHGLGTDFLLVVFIHGTLEISAIIIAGGAGLTLGNSILFPQTYSRLESLKRGAKAGMKIVIGLVPIFLIAAFLESFVTRYTNMPIALSLFILIGSAVFIAWYVIIYPRRLNATIQQTNAEKIRV